MKLIESFRNGAGVNDAVVVEVEGYQFLFTSRRLPEVQIWPWHPAWDGLPSTDPWKKLHELIDKKLVEEVYEGLSIAHDDRYVWRGEPVPGLDMGEGRS